MLMDAHPYYSLSEEDKIQALEESVTFGYEGIVDILLQNFKFDVANELLNTAVTYNHKRVVATLLERGFEINGDSKPLHVAVRHSHYDVVELLLRKGANPNLLDEANCTPLDIAAHLADADMFEILLSENAHIRIESKFILSAAESSVRANQVDIIKLLIQKKFIDANVKDIKGSSLLHISALSGSLDTTRCLVAEGADINSKDEKGRKPVHIAAEKGFKDMVEFYLKCNNLGDETAALLLIAVSNGKANVCELLIDRNADVNAFHADDESPIHLAVVKDHAEVLSVLLNYGAYYNANPSTLLELTEDNDATSLLKKVKKLFTAVKNNAPFEVETLLKEESNSKYCLANAKCVKKETMLHYASWKGYERIVDILLKHNTNPNTRTKTGVTPLHYAVKYSHFRIVKSLLSNGAIYNALSRTGKTPLEYATDRKIRDFLLFLRYFFKKVQDNDITVLENLRGKNEDVMRAVIRAKNQKGKTLLEVAYICSFTKTEQLQMLFETDICRDFTLGEMLLFENKLAKASLEFESLLRKRVEIFGADSQPVLDVKKYQAHIFHKQGNLDKALNLSREVHESRINCLGEDHEKTLLDKANIAFFLQRQGKKQESLKIFETLRIKLKDRLEKDDLKMIEFDSIFSTALFEMKKFDEALKLNHEIEQTCAQRMEVPYRILLSGFLFNTAKILSSQRKHSEALRLFKEVYETRLNSLTLSDSSTLNALRAVAIELHQLKKYEESLEVWKKVLDIQKSHHPADQIGILESQFHKGYVLCGQGMKLKALKIFLSLQPKIAVVAPDSDIMKANEKEIASIKYDLSSEGFKFVFDAIQNSIAKDDGIHEK
ncbi:Ankyrin-1 [Araneus ventricosus]|uniref:Alpha-latrotoxin n=1 Tax=Araneus ventricosus TaxID=182803 RepID=A0A4Y2SYQ2_ARAVE|nr:Ankyrin-1 [Araneus ventricosus]